uniref:Olfactory receptor n=1 Tax=Geotrypetes seraphini TaxID=260995 RepID=A0A6P8PJ33_GEOSA|nr:olfactory receptor 11L1-like [Geotrypetes seraphini]XP_033781485.1 olfactory receptor 11L1-like [Geotrypetes seraphini]
MADNDTTELEFLIAGFNVTWEQGVIAFTIFFTIYLLTVLANILIITLVRLDRHLQKPMYFFLTNFSFLEIWITTATVPIMLAELLRKISISQKACILHFYFCAILGAMENYLLAVMSLDRFIAICYPLRYPVVMNDRVCVQLAGGAWFMSFMSPLLPAVSFSQLSFCGPRVIDHFYCDFSPLIALSCTRNSISEISFRFLARFIILGCFTLIMLSYVFIIMTIVKMPSTSGRRNAFTTCTSHLTVVFIYYGTLIFIYVCPYESNCLNKMVSVVYTAVTPLLNPIIYTLRNQEVKAALKRTLVKLKELERVNVK